MKKFVVRDYRISLDEKRFQGCGLVTAVLLSDLHGVWHGEGQKALVKAVKDQNPGPDFKCWRLDHSRRSL